MSDLKRTIADLEAQRAAIYTNASGRWLTAAEREQVQQLTKALNAAWELRRMEQAQRESVDHELVIVSRLKERTV